jgi:hypothetical protein
MELKIKPVSPLVRLANYKEEKDLLLMKYQGIFRNNIKEYADTIKPLLKKKKNYSK